MRRLGLTIYTDKSAAENGVIDGQAGIPHIDDDELNPYLKQLIEVGHSTLQGGAENYKREDTKLRPNWESAHQAFIHAQEALPHPEAALNHAEAQYETEHKKKAPASDGRFTRYWWAVALLGLGEIALNEIAFRGAHESEAMTLLFTLTLAASVMACSHFVGIKIRSKQFVAAVALSVVAIAVIVSIAWIRAQHLTAVSQSLPARAQVHSWHHAAMQSSQSEAAQPTNETATLLAYFSFNLLLFIVMVVYSYTIHDQLLEEIFKWRKALATAKANYRTAHKRYSAAYAERVNRHAQYQRKAVGTIKNVMRLVEVYKTHNLRARTDRDGNDRHYPKCFDNTNILEIPPDLLELTWDGPIEAQTAFGESATTKETTDDIDTLAREVRPRNGYQNGAAALPLGAQRNGVFHEPYAD